MKRATSRGGRSLTIQSVSTSRPKKNKSSSCSICGQLAWLHGVSLMEPESAPEPRQSWFLCKQCYNALILEMRRSPVRSHLRLRIAIGLVAAERSPNSYPTEGSFARDRMPILIISWLFVIFMLLHLVLLVLLAFIIK